MDEKAKAITDHRRAAARAAIRQALHEYNKVLVKEQWGWEYDPREGDLTPPPFEADIPREMEDVDVINIETQLDVTIRPDTPETGKPVEYTHQVVLSFSGAMAKSDWYINDYPDLELWDSDLNDHYVSIAAHRVLELTTKVTYDPSADEAHVDELVGCRLITHSY